MTTIINPHTRDLGGGFQVQRLLPSFPHKMVGPFIFFDHFGPVDFAPGEGIDVRPHPHIGLATVTYLFEGSHDASRQRRIRAAHRSRRRQLDDRRASASCIPNDRRLKTALRVTRLHGLQTWVALPKAHEQREPSFSHHAKAELPVISSPGVTMRVIAGTAFGQRAPTPTFSPIFYVAVEMAAGATLELPPEHEERAVYAVEGELRVDGLALPPRHMAVLEPDATVRIDAASAVALHVARRRKDGWRPHDLVELRREFARTDRRCVRALARAGFSARARRDGIHPAPGA